jgi:hypothetical protein
METEDFVTDARGVKTSKIPPIIYFNGQKRRITPERSRFEHGVLRQLMGLTRGAADYTTTEAKLAEACKTDKDSPDWDASLRHLEGHGFLVVTRRKWDGVKAYAFVPLAGGPEVTLLNKGRYFAEMSFDQCMQLAEGR